MHRLLLILLLASCVVGSDEDFPDGDDGSGAADDLPLEPFATDLTNLDIGFNDGYIDQFDYYSEYFAGAITFGPRLCHTYVAWDVATQPPGSGAVTDHSSRAYVEAWFAAARGHCDEALISFKARGHGAAPSTAAYGAAIIKFASTNWGLPFSLTPWNEPNNGADDGNGLGAPIDARLAARYYLAAAQACRTRGCKVAAGDFATNGDMWNDLEWNCANDNVAPASLCKDKSSANPGNKPASYLDRYKNEIVARAPDFGFAKGFRPDYFAYHGWHDTNLYLADDAHCTSYSNCALRRLLRSLGGSWSGVAIWNTEDGVGQKMDPTDDHQACGAAFMLRLSAITSRVRRLYITRLHGGTLRLLGVDRRHRPALKVFQQRERTFAATCR